MTNINYLNGIPAPDTRRIAVRIAPRAEAILREGHPWLYENAVTSINREGAAGDVAVIFDRKNRFLAAGLYDPSSPIRVRLLVHRQPQTIDQTLFNRRLTAAAEIRSSLPATGTTGYRLVHGANDGFPGIVIDRYNSTLVVKLYTAAWVPHLPALISELENLPAVDRIILRLSRQLQRQPELLFNLSDGATLLGSSPGAPIGFSENALLFEADVLHGQKTGFFLDQRENRERVAGLAEGRKVLNAFSYSGGFSLYAASGGAVSVTDIDQSQPALEAAQRHFMLNHHYPGIASASYDSIRGDVFTVLPELAAARRQFDLVVLDPPAFARRKEEVPGALKAYGRLARQGLALLRPGGILVASSCSSRITEAMFFDTVHKTARNLGRQLQEIERTGHGLDHPVGFKEGAYLKTLFAKAP